MKGKVKIQLYDKDGKLKKEVNGDNIITNAVNSIINPNVPNYFECYTPVGSRMNPLTQYTPIANNTIGGILLFNSDREEDVNHVLPNDVDMLSYIGSAGGVFTSISDKVKGTLNVNETTAITNGYRFVWDFGQGSAFDLKSLSLTSLDGGNCSLNFDFTNDTTKSISTIFKQYGKTPLTESSSKTIACSNDMCKYTNINSIKVADYGTLAYVSRDFKTLILCQLSNSSYILTKFNFKESIGINTNIKEKSVGDSINDYENWVKEYTYTITPTTATFDSPTRLFFDENYFYSCYTTYEGANLTIHYIKIDASTCTIAEEEIFTITSSNTFGSTYKAYMIINGKLLIVDNNNNCLLIIDLETKALETSLTFTKLTTKNVNPIKFSDELIGLFEAYYAPSYMILINLKNFKIYHQPLKKFGDVNIDNPYMWSIINLNNSPVFIIPTLVNNYIYFNMNIFTCYIASIFNLDSYLSKTETDTLKIIYEVYN